MGTTIPTAIGTPTITILFHIFYLATTTIPTAIGTPTITILILVIDMGTITIPMATSTATAVGTEDIVDHFGFHWVTASAPVTYDLQIWGSKSGAEFLNKTHRRNSWKKRNGS